MNLIMGMLPILLRRLAAPMVGWLVAIATVHAAPSDFTYQGRLLDAGLPANGSFDLQFTLYDNSTGGTAIGTETKENVTSTNGLFSVVLSFGADSFGAESRYLAIGVREGVNTGAYALLPSRQELTFVPQAQYALKAGTLTGQLTTANIPTGLITADMLASGAVTGTHLQTGSITGFVGCNSVSPLEAEVYIAGESFRASVGENTPSGDPYRLSNVPAGNYTVVAKLASGDTKSQNVEVIAGQNTIAHFPFLVEHFADQDGDGYGESGSAQTSCNTPAGRATASGDFNDNCGTCYPGAPEICDGIDNNGNTQIDEGTDGVACYNGPAGTAGVGRCASGVSVCTNGTLSCSGELLPITEACNSIDDNCNGAVDEGSAGCAAGTTCVGNVCKSSNGSACVFGGTCASGFCRDNVCCDSACTSTCSRCNLAGSVGVCSFIAAGTDPDNECSGSTYCTGAGSCTPACVPNTCLSLGKNCGLVSDGCGNVIDCGTCVSPQTCGGSGVLNVCGGG